MVQLAAVSLLMSLTTSQETPLLPEGAKAYTDLSYVTKGHEKQKLDLYVPASSSKLPLLIHVHGGAWMGGQKNLNAGLARYLTKGMAVADINYRLSQDAIWPAQIEDCKAAVRWLRANAGKYNLDPKRIAVMGESAGGHLVAMMGTTSGVKKFDVGENLDQSSAVQGVIDHFGPTDFLQMESHAVPGGMPHNVASSPESRLIGGPIQENKDKVNSANPITYISKTTPPFLIAHGTVDRLVPCHQSELLYEALNKAGIEVTLHKVEGGDHGYQGASRQQHIDLNNKVEAFLKAVLKLP